MSLRVKICGLCQVADAMVAVELGASHLGMVLASDSPRRASLSQVRAIRAAVGDAAELVLVFRAATAAAVRVMAAEVGVRSVQVHGATAEQRAAMRTAGLLVLPVLTVAADATALPGLPDEPASATAPVLLDGGSGGAGQRFAWDLLGARGPAFTFVAGGITPDNVAGLLCHRPWGIDLCSGVEVEPGRKDAGRLRALFRAVAAAR